MIRVVLAIALLTIVTVLCIYPWVAAAAAGSVLVMLVPAMFVGSVREAIPVARIVRKRKTGRRFQRPVLQRAS